MPRGSSLAGLLDKHAAPGFAGILRNHVLAVKAWISTPVYNYSFVSYADDLCFQGGNGDGYLHMYEGGVVRPLPEQQSIHLTQSSHRPWGAVGSRLAIESASLSLNNSPTDAKKKEKKEKNKKKKRLVAN